MCWRSLVTVRAVVKDLAGVFQGNKLLRITYDSEFLISFTSLKKS